MSGDDAQQRMIEARPTASQEGLSNLELSSVEADEKALETAAEKAKPVLEAESEKAGAGNVTTLPVPTSQQIQALEKDQITVEVENILERGLTDIYGSLPDDVKPIFKQKGEETARTLSEMIKKAALKLGDVMKLIFGWLKIIPNTNRFYLEQEAKIRADQVLALAEEIKAEKAKI